MKLTLRFKFQKETKGTYRYSEVHGDEVAPAIGTLYIRKYAVEGEKPDMIMVELRSYDSEV